MVLLSLLGLPYQLPQHVAEALHPFPRASTLCCMTRLIVQCWEKKKYIPGTHPRAIYSMSS